MPTIIYVEKRDESLMSFSMNTYREFKSKVKLLINESIDNQVSVYRKRRGQWGEWFEHWSLDYNGKLIITKQGWM